MLRRFCMTGMLCAGLAMPAYADLVGDVATLEDILNSVCGQRYDVIWVDQDKEIPPCLMSYSQYCVEIQKAVPESCQNVLGDKAANLEPPNTDNTITADASPGN
ncbi:hypothetical protein WG78_17135 [Amantichitinum ursilacus]|uniref:Uncharacterized protein n=2 Tax=Amantichitinum ursilacus TaxID=857265 RepID=A0A0N0XJB2_9NEIS|nr:hypothetical protein WG78_17135 [Amantichitinum ursilacus]